MEYGEECKTELSELRNIAPEMKSYITQTEMERDLIHDFYFNTVEGLRLRYLLNIENRYFFEKTDGAIQDLYKLKLKLYEIEYDKLNLNPDLTCPDNSVLPKHWAIMRPLRSYMGKLIVNTFLLTQEGETYKEVRSLISQYSKAFNENKHNIPPLSKVRLNYVYRNSNMVRSSAYSNKKNIHSSERASKKLTNKSYMGKITL